MGNKSRLLSAIAGSIESATVPDFICIPLELRDRADEFVEGCATRFRGAMVAVRSDASIEDGRTQSHAGKFLTLLDVELPDVRCAIAQVFASVDDHACDDVHVDRIGGIGGDDRTSNAVIVQRMVGPSAAVCVGSTHRITDGAPWYCLDIAPSSGPAVTNGEAQVRHVAVPRSEAARVRSIRKLEDVDRRFLAVLIEVEAFFGGIPVEIEAAIGRDDAGALIAHLLQVRMLSGAVTRSWRTVDHVRDECRLPSLAWLGRPDEIDAIGGTRTVLSLMSDWNPAELIGAHPRPLALSLYRTLIAHDTWWNGRARLGYTPRPNAPIDLLRVMHGRPFVDVRRSANSMLPAGLSRSTSSRIVDAWLERLARQPALHDKVEYSIFRTVRDFALRRADDADAHGLDAVAFNDWNVALDALSRAIARTGDDSPLTICRVEAERYARTFERRKPWTALLPEARNVATLFASVARLAFVGDAQLRSAVDRGAITSSRAFDMRSVASIDAIDGDDDRGHLRPGTFEITARATSELGTGAIERRSAIGRRPQRMALGAVERRSIERLLREAGYQIGAAEWTTFVTQSLRARERTKFILSRYVSAILEQIVALSVHSGIDRDMMSWLRWTEISDGEQSLSAARAAAAHLSHATAHTSHAAALLSQAQVLAEWTGAADAARRRHQWESTLIVSPILIDDNDRLVAISSGVLPNFIGRTIGEGRIVALTDPDRGRDLNLAQSIVVTNRADPGYDWLFARDIAGLITAWGGANSHLGIRCAEHRLPAAIGCGEAFVTRAMAASHARIDPLSGGVWLR